jgi:hypothetical protein
MSARGEPGLIPSARSTAFLRERGGVSGAVTYRCCVPFTPASQPKLDASDFGQRRPRSDEMCFESAVALRIYLVSGAAHEHGPVAQGIEQQPSKLKVAGSNPAGVATSFRSIPTTWVTVYSGHMGNTLIVSTKQTGCQCKASATCCCSACHSSLRRQLFAMRGIRMALYLC